MLPRLQPGGTRAGYSCANMDLGGSTSITKTCLLPFPVIRKQGTEKPLPVTGHRQFLLPENMYWIKRKKQKATAVVRRRKQVASVASFGCWPPSPQLQSDHTAHQALGSQSQPRGA